MKKVLVVFGTRPEAIKMAPMVRALQNSRVFQPVTCATAQHRGLLDQVLEFFEIRPDVNLNLMQPNQDLFDITINCLAKMKEVLKNVQPDIVLVQGDTTTSFAAGLAAFYSRIPIGHVEAGLRTHDKYSPFPEEINRHALSPMVDYHFAPTEMAAENLRNENVPPKKIFVTGNTSIDALLWTAKKAEVPESLRKLYGNKKLILMTAHRRENFGEPLATIFTAVGKFLKSHPDHHIIYPVHPNPNVKGVAQKMLGSFENISLIEPVGYQELVSLLKACSFVLTDSGGLQEEAPTLGKPVLVLRETTERPEAVAAGCALLVGHDPVRIAEKLETLCDDRSSLYQSMSKAANPFGSGTTGAQIVSILESERR